MYYSKLYAKRKKKKRMEKKNPYRLMLYVMQSSKMSLKLNFFLVFWHFLLVYYII